MNTKSEDKKNSRRSFLYSSIILSTGFFSYPAMSVAARVQSLSRDTYPDIGLALGSGGANGLAHIPVLETLDELKIKPAVISGTSIGAIIGVLYASGYSGHELRKMALDLFAPDESLFGSWWDRLTGAGLSGLLSPGLGDGVLLDATGIMEFIQKKIRVKYFEDLDIPVKIVAADYWRKKQVVFGSGEIIPAVNASMAVPGLFAPVEFQGRLLVDGAVVNPVPYDLLLDECDFLVAVDVSGVKKKVNEGRPSYLDSIFSTFEIMQQAIMDEKLKQRPPDIYLRPEIIDVRLINFLEVQNILEQAEPARIQLKALLREMLEIHAEK